MSNVQCLLYPLDTLHCFHSTINDIILYRTCNKSDFTTGSNPLAKGTCNFGQVILLCIKISYKYHYGFYQRNWTQMKIWAILCM